MKVREFIKDSDDGMNPKELAKKYGISLSTCYKFRIRLGINRYGKYPADQIECIKDLYADIKNYKQVAEQLHISISTVKNIVKGKSKYARGT